MELIFAAACCSVLVSILLKIAKQKGFDVFQMIAWNYASASVCCFLWFKPDLIHVSIQDTPWWLIALLGILLPSIFLCLAKSLQYAGIIRTEIAQRLSVILSLLAAYLFFQEQFSSLKLIGIALGLVAVLSILYSHRQENTALHQHGMRYVALVWSGYALIDILLKYTTGLGVQFTVALNLMFIFAFVLSLVYSIIRFKTVGQGQNIIAGLFLGLLNFANIALYVKAHILLKDSPAIVFAGMNMLVVVLGVLAGWWFFHEKMNRWSGVGLVLGVLGIFVLACAM